MKTTNSLKYLLGFSPFFLSLIFVPVVLAKDGPRFFNEASFSGTRRQAPVSSDGGRLKSCEARQESLIKRAEKLLERATKMQEKFDKIALRVETYYTEKVLPEGKVVSNYDALVADIAAKKALVGAALTKAQTDADNFTCDGATVKDQMTQYRKDMQGVIKALKNYRTSIKNLIIAVRSVNGEAHSEKTPSPSPIATP